MDLKSFLKSVFVTRKMSSVTRRTLNKELKKELKKLVPGKVLDVGAMDSPYKKYISHTKYQTLDIDEKTNPDIIGDLHRIPNNKESFDTVIATEVLEHLQNPQQAINEIYRILKPRGICVLSTRFVQLYHPSPKDYYRFSEDSLKHLFKDFQKIKIIPHGNRFLAIWEMINTGEIGIILNLFNPLIALFNIKDKKWPLGFIVIAIK